MVSSWPNKPHSLAKKIKSSEDGVRLPVRGGVIVNGRTRSPLTLWTVPVLVHVGVWVCTFQVTLGWGTLRLLSVAASDNAAIRSRVASLPRMSSVGQCSK